MDLSLLKKKNPLLLLLGQLVSEFGSLMQSFALSIYVLNKTGSATQFASVLVFAIVPNIILSPFAGVVADRISRKKMIVALDMLSGLVTLGFAWLFIAGGGFSMWMVYLLVILISLAGVFFQPAIQAMIPDIVPKSRLADANSMIQLIFSVVSIAAPIVAGALYTAFGILVILILNGLSFIFSSISEMFIKIEKESVKAASERSHFFSELGEGFAYLWRTPVLLVMMMVAVIANFALAPVFTLAGAVVLLKNLGVTEYAYGLYQAIVMAGPIAGSLIAPSIIKKVHFTRIVPVTITASGILIAISCVFFIPGRFGEGYMANMAGMLALYIVMLMGIVITNLSIGTARQHMVPGRLMGRVIGATSTVAMVASPAGQMIMGPMIDGMGAVNSVLIYAAILLVSGLLAFAGFGALIKRGKVDMTMGLEIKETKAADGA